jgi:hypothetical protein
MSREIGVRGAEILTAAAIFAVLSWARRAGERVVVGEPHARWPASLLIEKTEEWIEAVGGWIWRCLLCFVKFIKKTSNLDRIVEVGFGFPGPNPQAAFPLPRHAHSCTLHTLQRYGVRLV